MKNFLILFLFLGMTFSFTACGKETETREQRNIEENTQKNVQKNQNNNYFVEDITLNSGHKMPVLGLGTWTLSEIEAENSVYTAIKAGYRLIDTARYYGNETGVGKGVKRAVDEGIVKREEVFITTKIMPSSYSSLDKAIDESLNNLGLGYIDLMLIHQPGQNDENVYKALERGVKSGKIRSIGISNYYTPDEVERIIKIAEIMPAVIQNENHIYYQNSELQKYVEKYGIKIESWYPFGGRGNTQESFNNEVIKKIAGKYNKTSPQIILRWHIQAGYIVIPGSKNPKHIEENYNIYDFELTGEEMKEIANINKNRRYENW